MTQLAFGAAGRRRSPVTLPGFHAGRPPRDNGIRYPADVPTLDEIVALMRHTADSRHGRRLRAMIVVVRRVAPPWQQADPRPRSARLSP